MDKGFTRTGRRSKYGAVRTSGSEDSKTELVNGGSVKEKIDDSDEPSSVKSIVEMKTEPEDEQVEDGDSLGEKKTNTAENSEFHGFDESSAPSGASVLNKLVGKYEADLEDQDSSSTKGNDDGSGEALATHKVLGHDIYTDSEDESSKPSKGAKEVKLAPKKRPLEKLAEAEAEDEKPVSPPPAKRARKKSAKAREASGDGSMKPLSDVSSEVTSSADVPRKNKAVKEESHSEVTSSAGTPVNQTKRAAESGSSATRARHLARDCSDPKYLKPMEQGWKRELVYRKTEPKGSDPAKRTGDIYYYTPAGKKVRSRVEILEHLRGTNLTVEHFCFQKEPLGLDDPSKEIIREASVRKSLAESSPAVKKEKSPKIPKQKALKGASAADSPVLSDETSNASAGGSNGTATSPPSASGGAKPGPKPGAKSGAGAKSGTPRVVLKSTKSPKPGPKAKMTPSRKSNAESSPTKTKGGRSKKENSQSNEGELESGTLPQNWESKDPASTPNSAPGAWKAKSKRVKILDSTEATVESTTAGGQNKATAKRDMENFISDLSSGYLALLHVMGYLKVQELLRASRVCRMWKDISLHPNLWHTVRMKNSQVSDWDGFAAALSARGTRVLDLRKMLAPGRPEDIEHMWSEFCRVIGRVDSLTRVELSRCPASVVEQLATSCPQLRVINAIAIKSEEVDLDPIRQAPLLEELRLKSNNGMNITRTLDPLLSCRLKHLSLTSVRNLGSCNVEVISELHNLESLELGDCVKLSNAFGPDHLTKLTKLERLRLEKAQVPGCPVTSLIESISKLPALRQLEIINFDVKPGFDKALAMCKQVRRLLIIPTYITTSAATNHIVLCSIPLLADSLEYLVWGLTQELTRVTDLFIDQCEARKGVQGSSKLNSYPGECIPIIKPVLSEDKDKKSAETDEDKPVKDSGEAMDVDEENKSKEEGKDDEDKSSKDEAASSDIDEVDSLARGFRTLSAMDQTEESPSGTPPVSILPIPKLQKLLVQLLPNTRVKILKVPFLSTWRQTFPELSSFH